MVEAKLLRKKLKNGLIVDKWDLVNIIEKQQKLIEEQDKKIIELAFRAVYAERSVEVIQELTNDQKENSRV